VSFACWWSHRRVWVTLVPGILPWKLDGDYFCPLCDKGGTRARVAYVNNPLPA
jgi:hypothetical protein